MIGNIYMYQTPKSTGLYCFSRDSKGNGLPESFAPWTGFGVIRPDQNPPHGLSRSAIETGISANGYQLWRQKPKAKPAKTPVTNSEDRT